MNPIETRGEARKRKERERKAAKRMDKQFRNAEYQRKKDKRKRKSLRASKKIIKQRK